MMVKLTTLHGEDAVKAVKKVPSVRTDLVQSNDDRNKHLLLETTTCTEASNEPTISNDSHVSTWNVLYPIEEQCYSVPVPGDPLYFLVFFYIKPQCVSDFIGLLLEEAKLVHELEGDGNIRFDLYQNTQDSTKFVVLEVLRDQEALAKHSRMPHYLKVREALSDMQALPRSHDKGYRVLISSCGHE
jgi:autoinducer 2-degrading protein